MTSTFPGHTDATVLEADGISLLRREIAETTILTVGGNVDVTSAPHLAAYLDQCVAEANGQLVVVDLSDVTFLAAAGISALVQAHGTACTHGGELRVVANTFPVRRPLTITSAAEELAVYVTVAQALTAPDAR
jgi:anti-sigma B factor antagonist